MQSSDLRNAGRHRVFHNPGPPFPRSPEPPFPQFKGGAPGARGPSAPRDAVSAALANARRRLVNVAAFSGAINVLTLSGSIYMLQVYDRVLPSRSLATLAGLSLILLTAYALQGYLDSVRARMLTRIGALFDAALQEPIFRAIASLPLKGTALPTVTQPLRDLEQVRSFLSGMGPTAFLDMPWIPIFVLGLFVFHPLIGLAASAGAGLIVATTLIADQQSKIFSRATAERATQRAALAEATARNADAVHALGMTDRFAEAWRRLNEAYIAETTRIRDVEADIGAFAKMLRYVLQSGVLALGAALVIAEQASPGVIIASSIMMGRALAPIEVALGTWKQLVSARQALERLSVTLRKNGEPPPPAIYLPRPCKLLTVQQLSVALPGSAKLVTRNISFALKAGAGMALLGPSGSGKSSLAKALVGVWQTAEGAIRLDGARLDQWHAVALGQHIGYLPQEAGLFDGTVAENISRFDRRASDEQIIEAAAIAGAHGLILSLPEGYASRIGEGGSLLSAGQRQRIGLARAVFGNPFLIVLDEPNANLDAEGEAALARAISVMRARQSIVIVISHRVSALAALDTALVLQQGQMLAFGPRDQVLARLAAAARDLQPPVTPDAADKRETADEPKSEEKASA